jgi:hypothetical protein
MQILMDIGKGRSSHGLPLAWPVTEPDVDATYLARLDRDDEVRLVKVEEDSGAAVIQSGPIALSDKGGASSPGHDAEGRRGTSQAGAGGDGPTLSQANTSTEKPEAISKQRTHRGQKCIYDGRAIAGLYKEEIMRQTQLVRPH